MDDLRTLMQKLQQQAVEDAMRISPAFKERVEADRREIEEHEKMLEAERVARAQREEPKNEWTALWQKMRTPKS